MHISRHWLADYVKLDDISNQELESLLTTKIAEVDGYELVGTPLVEALVCEVLGVEPHPKADSLNVLEVSTGKEKVCVVSGAPNVAKGMLSAYIPPGTTIYASGSKEKQITVDKREIKGIASIGVLVSEAELGITADHSGVIELTDKAAKPGMALAKLWGDPDTVFEIDNKSLTHRPDLWSHFGFARELAAILGRKLTKNPDEYADDPAHTPESLKQFGSGKSNFRISIEKGCGCRRFAGIEISGVSALPSPLWMRRRLFACGMGVRNQLVDLSNYVMADIGQPNHAYDADKLDGNEITARRAKDGEKFLGLDDVERTLVEEDIVIADAAGTLGLGGVIGGARSAVSESTKRLFVESANFDPVIVRKTAKRHATRTDASNRFEKSRSAYSVPLAIGRFLELLAEFQPGAVTVGEAVEQFLEKPPQITVPCDFDSIRKRLGAAVPDKRIEDILSSLGFGVENTEIGNTGKAVPYYRATRDVSIPEDLVEEVGRIYGYEEIPEQAPLIASEAPARDELKRLENRVRDCLAGMGFSEISSYSFQNEKLLQELGYGAGDIVRIKNPVSAEESCLRTSLVPSLLQAAIKNARQSEIFALFELGRSYHLKQKIENSKQETADERRMLCLAVLSGSDSVTANSNHAQWGRGTDFYQAMGAVKRLIRVITPAPLEVLPAVPGSSLKPWMHPSVSAELSIAGVIVGVIAEVRPDVLEDVPARLVVSELDVGRLLELERSLEAEGSGERFSEISKFPTSLFEMSVVMPKHSYFSELSEILTATSESRLIKRLEVVAVYNGKPLAEDEKSVSVKLHLGATDRTLSSEELASTQGALIAAVERSEFSLRS